jgi:hypothetical protein
MPGETVPGIISFGALNLGQPRRAHLTLCDKFLRFPAIDSRPRALGASRCELLQRILLVKLVLLNIDPAET